MKEESKFEGQVTYFIEYLFTTTYSAKCSTQSLVDSPRIHRALHVASAMPTAIHIELIKKILDSKIGK